MISALKKIKQAEKLVTWAATSYRVIKEGFSEAVTDLGKSMPTRENSKCKSLQGGNGKVRYSGGSLRGSPTSSITGEPVRSVGSQDPPQTYQKTYMGRLSF